MPKKLSPLRIIGGWFSNHPWLKIISLALAVLVWFYVKGELNNFR